MAILRTENCSVLYGVEGSTWAQRAQPAKRFGIHETVNAPDPDQDWYPFFGVFSPRSRATILRGKWNLRGGIPDIKIQQGGDLGSLLALCIGRLEGNVIKEGLSTTDERQGSMTMQIAERDTDGNYAFIREYYGGKVNRWTLSASEGEQLKLSIDEVIFKDVRHNISGVAKFDAAVQLGTDPGPDQDGNFYFAGATVNIFGTNVARIKRFSLSGNNMLAPKFYLNQNGDPSNLTQVCNDIIEGRRSYSLDIELDAADVSTDFELFKFLMNEGGTDGGNTVGGIINATFAVTPGQGAGTLAIACGLTTGAGQPGPVVTGGKINVPSPPEGLFPGNWTVDVDRVQITVPS